MARRAIAVFSRAVTSSWSDGALALQVAACICLFSLDKAAAIPVDTHVWQLAVRYYLPHLRGGLRRPCNGQCIVIALC